MVTDRRRVEHSCWIVLAPFCAMGFIFDARYLNGDFIPPAVKQFLPRGKKFLFRHKESPIAGTDLRNF